MKRLKVIMGVFGFSYILRFVFDMLISIQMSMFCIFVTDYPGFTQLVLMFYFFITDVLPIGMIFYMHYVNYRQDQEARVVIVGQREAENEEQRYNANADQYVQVYLGAIESVSETTRQDQNSNNTTSF